MIIITNIYSEKFLNAVAERLELQEVHHKEKERKIIA